jgi:hypothetical protein
MDIEKIENEIIENGNRKVNIGVKAYSELKLKLSDEAKALEISLSEHCENILITHSGLLEEVKVLSNQLEELKQKNSSLNETIASNDSLQLKNKISTLTEENVQLKKYILELKSNQQIFADSRLEYLFKRVKGQRDTIITDIGEMNITFNTPKDVLLALIYSFTI